MLKVSDHTFHLPVHYLFVHVSTVLQTDIIRGGIRTFISASDLNVVSELETVCVCVFQ